MRTSGEKTETTCSNECLQTQAFTPPIQRKSFIKITNNTMDKNGICPRSANKTTKGIRLHKMIELVEPITEKKYKVCDKCGTFFVNLSTK